VSEREDFSALRLVVVFLRAYSRKTQAEFGRESQVDQADVSRIELGKQVPPEETLRRMAKAAGVPWHIAVHLRRFYEAALPILDDVREVEPEQGFLPMSRADLEHALLAVTPYLLDHSLPKPLPTPEQERREAEEVWQELERYPMSERRRLVELSPLSSRNWALAALVCDASLQTAEHTVDGALELADLALVIAGKLRGDEGWRSRVQGYAWAHIGNARRATGDLAAAAAAFVRAWSLWRAGEGSAPERLLPESRLLDLEALLGHTEGGRVF
jgi:transcriptional regulator with XRE-family HTH domain